MTTAQHTMTTNDQEDEKAMDVSAGTKSPNVDEESDAKSVGQMDKDARDVDDGNACLLMEGKTEV